MFFLPYKHKYLMLSLISSLFREKTTLEAPEDDFFVLIVCLNAHLFYLLILQKKIALNETHAFRVRELLRLTLVSRAYSKISRDYLSRNAIFKYFPIFSLHISLV